MTEKLWEDEGEQMGESLDYELDVGMDGEQRWAKIDIKDTVDKADKEVTLRWGPSVWFMWRGLFWEEVYFDL